MRCCIHSQRSFTGLVLSASLMIGSAASMAADKPGESKPLSPLMVQLKEVYYATDFNDTTELNTKYIEPKDGSFWTIQDNSLIGKPSAVEHQRISSGHNGRIPYVCVKTPGHHFCISFRVRYSGIGIAYQGTGFGISRYGSGVNLNALGVSLTADHTLLQMMHDETMKLEDGKWYECMFEIMGEEIVVQFKGGPVLYGKHPSIYGKHGSPQQLDENGIVRNIFGIRSSTSSTVAVDDLKVWSIKPEAARQWTERRKKISGDYAARYKHGPIARDRKKIGAALLEMSSRDPNAKEIAAARKFDSETKKSGKDASNKRFSNLSKEEQEKIEKRKAQIAARRAKEAKEKAKNNEP